MICQKLRTLAKPLKFSVGGAGAPAQPEITSIVCLADTAGNRHDTSFTIYDSAGSVGVYLDAGANENTDVVCAADVSGSLHDTSFLIHDASGERSITLDCGGKAEITEFTLLSASSLGSGGAGKYFMWSGDSHRYCVWFCLDSVETEPDASGDGATAYIKVDVATGDSASTCAIALSNTIGGSTAGAVLTLAVSAGARTDAVDVNSGVTVSVLQQGRDAASGGGISVTISDNSTAAAIATAIAGAANGDGWTTSIPVAGTVRFTDASVGARADATNLGAVSSISLVAQGVNAASAPGGVDRTLRVPYNIAATAQAIATAIASACTGAAWTVVDTTPDTTIFTDTSNGARTDAVDVDTGFTISVTQQGS